MTNIKPINSNFLEIEAKRNPEFSGKLKLKTNVQINLLEKAKEGIAIVNQIHGPLKSVVESLCKANGTAMMDTALF